MTPRENKYHKRKRERKFLWNVQGKIEEYQLAYLKQRWDLVKICEDSIIKACGIPIERIGTVPAPTPSQYEMMVYKGARIFI